MKYFLVLVSVAVVLINGQEIPTRNCPPGEHTVLYCPRVAEPSCDNPTIHPLSEGMFGACGIPDCFCDQSTVRNTVTGQCVPLSECY